MLERYSPELARGKIARSIEGAASSEFGPELLKKGDVARCLNIPESELLQDDWTTISEFAINAGVDLYRAAIKNDLPENLNENDVQEFHKRIVQNKDRLIPYHDLFHAAETYRLSHGKKASPAFAEVDPRSRYLDPEVLAAELYPLLFLADPWMKAPLPVLIQSAEGRNSVARFFNRDLQLPKEAGKNIENILDINEELSGDEYQRRYEELVKTVVIGNARKRLGELTNEEVDAIHKQFQQLAANPPEHYANFAKRIFGGEWKTNPRLFVDELLTSIRSL